MAQVEIARAEANMRHMEAVMTAEAQQVESKAQQAEKAYTHNALTDDHGNPLTPGYRRLARAQHWRVCPSCSDVVERRCADGSAECPSCKHQFRWVAAQLVLPTASLHQLLAEFRWQRKEDLLDGTTPNLSRVIRHYWGPPDALLPPTTRGARVKLGAWRFVLATPLTISLPVLLLSAWLKQNPTERAVVVAHLTGSLQSHRLPEPTGGLTAPRYFRTASRGRAEAHPLWYGGWHNGTEPTNAAPASSQVADVDARVSFQSPDADRKRRLSEGTPPLAPTTVRIASGPTATASLSAAPCFESASAVATAAVPARAAPLGVGLCTEQPSRLRVRSSSPGEAAPAAASVPQRAPRPAPHRPVPISPARLASRPAASPSEGIGDQALERTPTERAQDRVEKRVQRAKFARQNSSGSLRIPTPPPVSRLGAERAAMRCTVQGQPSPSSRSSFGDSTRGSQTSGSSASEDIDDTPEAELGA